MLFIIQFVNSQNKTFVRQLIRLIVRCWSHSTVPFFRYWNAHRVFFFRSVGLSLVSCIMVRNVVISLIPNSPKALSILDGMSSGPAALHFLIVLRAFWTFSSRIWGPSSLSMIGGGPLSIWYNSVMYSDHLLRMSSFYIRMSPSLDRMHLVFADGFSQWPLLSFSAQFCYLLQCWILFPPTVCWSNVHLLHCTSFSIVWLVLYIAVRLSWLFFSLPMVLKLLWSSTFVFVFFSFCDRNVFFRMLSFIIWHLFLTWLIAPLHWICLTLMRYLFIISSFCGMLNCSFGDVFSLFSRSSVILTASITGIIWSLPQSALGMGLHDVNAFRNRFWKILKSIWFWAISPGLYHVQHLLGWSQKQMFITLRFCSLKHSMSLSPLSFFSPSLNVYITVFVLSLPTYELKSSVTIFMACNFSCFIGFLAVSLIISTSSWSFFCSWCIYFYAPNVQTFTLEFNNDGPVTGCPKIPRWL